jgi:hypothetical protein
VPPDFLEIIERDSNGTFDINKVSIWKVQAKFLEGGDCTGQPSIGRSVTKYFALGP